MDAHVHSRRDGQTHRFAHDDAVLTNAADGHGYGGLNPLSVGSLASISTDGNIEQQWKELIQFLHSVPLAIIKLTPEGGVKLINPAAVELLKRIQLDSRQLTGLDILDALSPGLANTWIASRGKVGPVAGSIHTRGHLADGHQLDLLLRVVRPDLCYTMISIEDVTASMAQARALQRSRQQLNFILEKIEGFCVAFLNVDGSLAEWNPSVDIVFQRSTKHLVGLPLSKLLSVSYSDDSFPLFPEIEHSVRTHGVFRRDTPLRLESGEIIWGELIVKSTLDGSGAGSGYMVTIRDASDHRDAQQRLMHEAMTDPLTGLLNRRGLALRLDGLARAPLSGDTLASWIMLDIDHFKRVNDTYGHHVGDLALKQIAVLLKSCSRERDIVVRLGGEEFVVVLPGVSLAAALAMAERFRYRLEIMELTVGSHTVRMTASCGVCVQDRDLLWSTALRAADEALYEAKSSGRNMVAVGASLIRLTSA